MATGEKKITTGSIFWALFFMATGVLLGLGMEHVNGNMRIENVLDAQKPIRSKTTYRFINPLLAYDSPEAAKEFNEYADLESIFSREIDRAKVAKDASRVSLYFRDLNYGRWVGINEDEGYEPASMLKVVIMIAYLKEAEYDPSILEQTYTYTQGLGNALRDIPNQAPSTLIVGNSYSVNDLINAMITESDNGAKDILLAHVSEDVLHDTYSDLGIPDPADATSEYVISSKTFSLFLRVLYNATYLSRNMSEKALQILSRATFFEGIVSGVPQGTLVAQKFGEHVYSDSAGTMSGIALSNCGLVYAPEHPYILCVMTQGHNSRLLARVIQNISRIAYEESLRGE